MSTLSDVQALYGSVRHTWENSHAHVVAHVALAGILFGICGVSIPAVSMESIDPKQISGNDWYKLAKDTGIVYVLFVVPVVLIAAYGALLRIGGQLLVTIVTLMFLPAERTNTRLLSPWALEPLALTITKSDFSLSDLQARASELMLKYQSQKGTLWDEFQNTINKLTKNSQIYLGDFLLFLLFWIAFFKLLPHTHWIQANKAHYWQVVVLLLFLSGFAWFRVSRAIAVVPSLVQIYVSMMVRSDPDMKSLLEVSDDKRDSIRDKLAELLRKERERGDAHPSLLHFLGYKTGFLRSGADENKKKRGSPFPSLYARGLRFSYDVALYAQYGKKGWASGYFAYFYFRLHKRVSNIARGLWQFIRYLVTGAP